MSESLNPETPVEVISSKNGKHWKKIMTLKEWKSLQRKPGFVYSAYQVGFSQFVREK